MIQLTRIRPLAGLAVMLGCAACSTVETRRADPATFEGSTTRTLADVQACLSDGFDRRHLLPSFRPIAKGSSYVLSGQGYVQAVLDVTDEGATRRLVLHAVTTIWGPDKTLTASPATACEASADARLILSPIRRAGGNARYACAMVRRVLTEACGEHTAGAGRWT